MSTVDIRMEKNVIERHYIRIRIQHSQKSRIRSVSLRRPHIQKNVNSFFIFVLFITIFNITIKFYLLDPDPYSDKGSRSGSSNSNGIRIVMDLDPQPCLQHLSYLLLTRTVDLEAGEHGWFLNTDPDLDPTT